MKYDVAISHDVVNYSVKPSRDAIWRWRATAHARVW